MAGRTNMVAAILGIVALAGAGCAAGPDLEPGIVARDAPAVAPAAIPAENPALIMALDTAARAAGPTPTISADGLANPTPHTMTPVEVMGFVPQSITPAQEALGFRMGLGAQRTAYGPNGALELIPQDDFGQPMEFSFQAPSGATGLPVDFALAHRRGADEGPEGRIESKGVEARLGQRIRGIAPEFKTPTWDKPAWYIFAASDNDAVTWTPAASPNDPNRALRSQDRVAVGDIQAGLSLEANGMQASLAYVKREVTTMDAIRHTEKANQEFGGITLTWRR